MILFAVFYEEYSWESSSKTLLGVATTIEKQEEIYTIAKNDGDFEEFVNDEATSARLTKEMFQSDTFIIFD